MIDINTYIVEKFKISKDINFDKYLYVLEKIFKFMKLSLEEEGEARGIKKRLRAWLEKNDVTDVYIFANKNDLDSYQVPKDVIDEVDYIDDNKAMDSFWNLLQKDSEPIFSNSNSDYKLRATDKVLGFKKITSMSNEFIFVKKDENT